MDNEILIEEISKFDGFHKIRNGISNIVKHDFFLIDIIPLEKKLIIGICFYPKSDNTMISEIKDYLSKSELNDYIIEFEVISGQINLRLLLSFYYSEKYKVFHSKNTETVYLISDDAVYRFSNHKPIKDYVMYTLNKYNKRKFYNIIMKKSTDSVRIDNAKTILSFIHNNEKASSKIVMYDASSLKINDIKSMKESDFGILKNETI